MKYDPYGQATVTIQQGQSASGNPYLFQGRRWDPEVGLYYFRDRVYSPVLGRFYQRDPVEWRRGINRYAYVENRPVVLLDPFGTQARQCQWVGRTSCIQGPWRQVGTSYGPWREDPVVSGIWGCLLEDAYTITIGRVGFFTGTNLHCRWVCKRRAGYVRDILGEYVADVYCVVRQLLVCDGEVCDTKGLGVTQGQRHKTEVIGKGMAHEWQTVEKTTTNPYPYGWIFVGGPKGECYRLGLPPGLRNLMERRQRGGYGAPTPIDTF